MIGAVTYNADESGYRVLVIVGGEIVDEYAAGNAPGDSVQVLPDGLSKATLLRYARSTALLMADELAETRRLARQGIGVAWDLDIEV